MENSTFYKFYKEKLENQNELNPSQSDKILNFIYKNSPFCKEFTSEILAFLDDYNFNPRNIQHEKIKKFLLCILADIVYIYENPSGTRAGGVSSFDYNERCSNILTYYADKALINLDKEIGIKETLGEAALNNEDIDRIKAEILVEHFAYNIMDSEANELENSTYF